MCPLGTPCYEGFVYTVRMQYLFWGCIGIVIIFLAWVAYGYFSVRNVEEPAYTVVRDEGTYEIRLYEPMVIAETTVESTSYRDALNEGFRRLADYIFGNNAATESLAMTVPVQQRDMGEGEVIAMTAPVVSEDADANDRVISFVLPSSYTLESAPQPKNAAVRLRTVPERAVAAVSFSWLPTQARIEAQKRALREVLAADDVRVIGEESVAFYNPPFTPPFMMRTEILIPVAVSYEQDQ